MFGLNTELECKFDFSNTGDDQVSQLLAITVLLIDEASMLDLDFWWKLGSIGSDIQNARRSGRRGPRPNFEDDFGDWHLILFGDFKQLPPCNGSPPFVIVESFHRIFDFEELDENRRVVADPQRVPEIENFHNVLGEISRGEITPSGHSFIIQAYVAGAGVSASNVDFEGSTAVFPKRRYRDRWNGIVIRRLARTHNHSLKIKGQCRAKGTRGQWYSKERTEMIRKRNRTQSLWTLHLAGDWNGEHVDKDPTAAPHLMRAMIVSNFDVANRFANGTQGRVLHWHPGSVARRKALAAGYKDLHIRFVKEVAYKTQPELQQVTDWMDVPARENTLTGRDGKSVLHQVPIVPAYALTVHKTQALSMKHFVQGCLEGFFAYGQLYVLASRMTDPALFRLIGLPPLDLLDEVAEAWQKQGLDVNKCFREACAITGEWEYKDATPGQQVL